MEGALQATGLLKLIAMNPINYPDLETYGHQIYTKPHPRAYLINAITRVNSCERNKKKSATMKEEKHLE